MDHETTVQTMVSTKTPCGTMDCGKCRTIQESSKERTYSHRLHGFPETQKMKTRPPPKKTRASGELFPNHRHDHMMERRSKPPTNTTARTIETSCDDINNEYHHKMYTKCNIECKYWIKDMFEKKIPPGARMFVCCECCVLSGRVLCDGLIIRPEESYRLWRVVVCDQETSYARRL
jgi:hypothetical protein